MNIGEMKVTPNFFNSQTQLNNEWFDFKSDSTSFEQVLEKTYERSEVEREPKTIESKDFKEVQKKMDKVDHQKDLPKDETLNEVKAKIKEAIAQKKFKKENAVDGEVDNLDLEEKIKNLEEAIMEELGLTEKPDLMALVAELLGVNLEVVEEQIMTEEGQVELLETLVDKVETGEINKKEVLSVLNQVKELLPEEKQVEFEAVLKEFVEKLPEGEAKDLLTEVQKDFEAPEKAVLKEVVTENKTTEFKAETELTKASVQTEQVTSEKPVEQATPKEMAQEQQQESSNKQGEPIMNAEIKVEQKANATMNIEEQINVMKAEGQTIVSAKETPKAILTRSVMNQVVQGTKMSVNMSDQGSEILIKLNPKNLGNVSLKMAFEKGTLLAQIQVENQTVKGIIESNLDELRSALQDEGYQIGDLDVSVNKENTGDGQQGFTGGQKKFVKHETFEEIEEKIMKQKASDEGIDYLA
jgi:flagellar hook-length control protein FliK